ncbi:MAG TPA: hypothetical protein P5323_04625, partial [Candidatus Moranbacteria bacterium]|nr:hypothetical protein [Smithellaceae bacterium]HRY28391.1 hypothetical protein [Candidatus Moranbacteria bacterium]
RVYAHKGVPRVRIPLSPPSFTFSEIEELEQIIENEKLDRDAIYKFVKNAFCDGSVSTTGTAIASVLPPVSRFSPSGERTKKRESVLNKLTSFFERFFDISGGKL